MKQNCFNPAEFYATLIIRSISNTFSLSSADKNFCLLGGRGD